MREKRIHTEEAFQFTPKLPCQKNPSVYPWGLSQPARESQSVARGEGTGGVGIPLPFLPEAEDDVDDVIAANNEPPDYPSHFFHTCANKSKFCTLLFHENVG